MQQRMGGGAIRYGLRPLDRPFVTLLGTAPGGPWGGFDRTLARACSHTRCPCQVEVRHGRGAATLPCSSTGRRLFDAIHQSGSCHRAEQPARLTRC
jgi:hypothetical protein